MRRWLLSGLLSAGRAGLAAIPRVNRAAWAALDLLLLVVGLALIVVGVGHWSRPAAFIVAGLALLALGVVPVRRRS